MDRTVHFPIPNLCKILTAYKIKLSLFLGAQNQGLKSTLYFYIPVTM